MHNYGGGDLYFPAPGQMLGKMGFLTSQNTAKPQLTMGTSSIVRALGLQQILKPPICSQCGPLKRICQGSILNNQYTKRSTPSVRTGKLSPTISIRFVRFAGSEVSKQIPLSRWGRRKNCVNRVFPKVVGAAPLCDLDLGDRFVSRKLHYPPLTRTVEPFDPFFCHKLPLEGLL